ncbi:MAG: hypothetical protein KA765_11220 [Thermoflexales bacterium]|nr:hypothetical protein [Thermoflexales bacterium]
MSLTALWTKSRSQLEGKRVHQIVAIAGDGRLRDGSGASEEFRDFLLHVPSSLLKDYVDQCLQESFTDSGLALQELVNEIGRRLGFQVTNGRYRGVSGQIGYDGVWRLPDGHGLVVEVKTTDVYSINLETVAKYRRELIEQNEFSDEKSSILIVLGREDKDTSGLEAQIRGSRYAWNIRIISVDALIRLMVLREDIEDPEIISRIAKILIPHEFTKLDGIIELVFSTAEDIKHETPEEEGSEEKTSRSTKAVSFYEACIKRIEKHAKQPLIKRSRTAYSTPDESLRLICLVSRQYGNASQPYFWFGFHKHQKAYLEEAKEGYAAFGCGSEDKLVLIPIKEFRKWLDLMHTTESESRFYWHVKIFSEEKSGLAIYGKKGTSKVDLKQYRV